MTIRAITLKDKESISLWKYPDQYSGFNYAVEDGGWLDLYCKSDCDYCFVAELEKNILGLFLFIPHKENEFRILINPDYLNRGYGKALTSQALAMAFTQLSFQEVSLIVRQNHPVAINLYRTLGFKIVAQKSEITNGEKLEFFKMIKSI